MKTLASIVCLTILFAAIGCSGDTSRGVVAGTVTYQGEPVAEGQIVFRLPDNSIVEGAIIKDGEFESTAPVGNCMVQITARRRIDVRPNPAMPDGVDFATVAYIPEKYNDQSTLNLEVTPGRQSHDFDLE